MSILLESERSETPELHVSVGDGDFESLVDGVTGYRKLVIPLFFSKYIGVAGADAEAVKQLQSLSPLSRRSTVTRSPKFIEFVL